MRLWGNIRAGAREAFAGNNDAPIVAGSFRRSHMYRHVWGGSVIFQMLPFLESSVFYDAACQMAADLLYISTKSRRKTQYVAREE